MIVTVQYYPNTHVFLRYTRVFAIFNGLSMYGMYFYGIHPKS